MSQTFRGNLMIANQIHSLGGEHEKIVRTG
jgi:hypothetical protein